MIGTCLIIKEMANLFFFSKQSCLFITLWSERGQLEAFERGWNQRKRKILKNTKNTYHKNITFVFIHNHSFHIDVSGDTSDKGPTCPLMQEMQEKWVWSLGQEDPLEEGMATHSNILAWKIPSLGWEDPLEIEMATHSSILALRIPCTEEPGGLQYMGSQRVRHDWATNTYWFRDFSMLPKRVI